MEEEPYSFGVDKERLSAFFLLVSPSMGTLNLEIIPSQMKAAPTISTLPWTSISTIKTVSHREKSFGNTIGGNPLITPKRQKNIKIKT
ncbi:MAG TPA: hypothetical protein PKZ70_01265 [Candidatus Atribacteria bacterium]|nr:hypothetical protein [Candidatus Atribacteria bacterium]